MFNITCLILKHQNKFLGRLWLKSLNTFTYINSVHVIYTQYITYTEFKEMNTICHCTCKKVERATE